MTERTYPTGVDIEEAIELLRKKTAAAKTETIFLADALGRVLAEDIFARENIPPFDRSPYDGFAFRSEDVKDASGEHPVTLRVTEEIPAGHYSERVLQKGEAVKILTGAPIPKGADAVEMFEKTVSDGKTVTFTHGLLPGSNICLAGEDVAEGTCLLRAGQTVDAAMMGLLASLGKAEILVYRKLLIGIISTGDELVTPQTELTPGKIRSSSNFMLKGWLESWGMEPEIYGIVRDDPVLIREALETCAARYDVVITTGGVSVGDYDFLQTTLEEMDADIAFWKVKMKPGMALLSGFYQGKLMFCLSGNPSAAAAAFHLIGRPVMWHMAGKSDWQYKKCKVRLVQGFPKESPGRRFIPGAMVLKGTEIWLDSTPAQGNGKVSPWSGCSLIAELPAGTPPRKAGDEAEAYIM